MKGRLLIAGVLAGLLVGEDPDAPCFGERVDLPVEQLSLGGHACVSHKAAGAYDPGFPGRQLNIFPGPDRQLRASVYMMDHKLYIIEALAGPGDFEALQRFG